MQITPILYILDGRCVSLYKGDIKQKKVYPKKPQNYASQFVKQGAQRLLLIDLNASEQVKITNTKIIKEIVQENPDTEIQYTGGLRTMAEVDKAFQECKVDKIIIGISGLTIIPKAIAKYGADKIFCGIKAKGKYVMSEFTSEDNKYEVFDLAQELKTLNVENILYHDIWSEGTLLPNYDEVEKIIATTDLDVFIGGGISQVKHLNLLRKIHVKGAYIGKALMENILSLKDLTIYEVL